MEQRYIGFHPSVEIYLLREEDLENGASFLRLRLPSALIRHDEGPFRKRCSNYRNLKYRLCVLVKTENILKTKLLETDEVKIIIIFPYSSFTQTNSKKLVVVVFTNFSSVVWAENN